MKKSRVLVLMLLWSATWGDFSTKDMCSVCTCHDTPPNFIVDCSSLDLAQPPSNLPVNLTGLFLNNNSISHVSETYFSRFPNLTILNVSDNVQLGLVNLSKSFYGLRKSKIHTISANTVVQEYGENDCIKLLSDFFLHLQNTQLKYIHLDKNRIFQFEPGALAIVPKSLEVLSMQRSRLVFSPFLLFELLLLGNLRKLDISQRNFENFYKGWNHKNGYLKRIKIDSQYKRSAEGTRLRKITVPLPPKLEELMVDSCSLNTEISVEVHFTKNRLKRLSLKSNLIDLSEGYLMGLNDLEEFDLSHNDCTDISSNLSKHVQFPKLSRLYLKGNNIELINHEHMFDYWTSLTVLDLSNNRISIVPSAVFHKLIHLEHLSMSGNIIYHFNVNLEPLKHLRHLDLSDNQISMLSDKITDQLEAIGKISNLTLDVTGNPIRCFCDQETLAFLKWIKNTKIHIAQRSNLTCISDKTKHTMNIIENYTEFKRSCDSPTRYYSLVLGTSVALTGCFCFIVMGIVYRYRYKLAYIYFVRRRRYRRNVEEEAEYNRCMEFDAYIAYADEDRHFAFHAFREKLEREGQLHLCFRDREFLPGEIIACSIVSHIGRSKHVVLVLSPDFLKSGWRRYELEMALCESIERSRSLVVLLKFREFSLHDLPGDMLRMMDTHVIQAYPETEEDKETFWKMLKETLSDV